MSSLWIRPMKIILTANKDGLLWTEFSLILEQTARKHKIGKEEIIPFPFIFEAACRKFSINKKKCWNCLFFMAEWGFIKIVPYHGIKLLYKIKNA